MNVPRSVCRELRRLLRPLPLGVTLMASTPGAGLAADLYPGTIHAKALQLDAADTFCRSQS
jgi:hypothetical protein